MDNEADFFTNILPEPAFRVAEDRMMATRHAPPYLSYTQGGFHMVAKMVRRLGGLQLALR